MSNARRAYLPSEMLEEMQKKTYLLEIYWADKGKKDYQVTGTRHAGNLLRKYQGAWNYARLHVEPGPLCIQPNDYGHLFDRNNTHY